LIRALSDEEHEAIWRILQALLQSSGARAALLCDAASGALLVSVGDATAQGEPDKVRALSPRERVVSGAAGQMYGVEVPGGALLAVLHGKRDFDRVRRAAAKAARETGAVLRAEKAPPKKKRR
jgi:hypothetical protein